MWQAILTGLGWCDRFVDGEPRERFRDFVRDLVRPALERLGWDAVAGRVRPDPRSSAASSCVASAILGDDPETQAQAGSSSSRPERWIRGSCGGRRRSTSRRTGDEGRPRPLLAALPSGRARRRSRSATCSRLAASRRSALIERVLAATMTDEIRTQDAPYLLARSTTNRDQGPAVWRSSPSTGTRCRTGIASSNIIALVVGHPVPHGPAGRRRGRRLLRRARHPPEPPDAPAGARADARRREAPRARHPGAARALRRLVARHILPRPGHGSFGRPRTQRNPSRSTGRPTVFGRPRAERESRHAETARTCRHPHDPHRGHAHGGRRERPRLWRAGHAERHGQPAEDDDARRLPRGHRALRHVVRVRGRGPGGRLDHPAPRRPDRRDQGRRLDPPAPGPRDAAAGARGRSMRSPRSTPPAAPRSS